ncbi:MAG: GNAT family N-acetyltransferase [Candidatus Thorarchaeota archaeon]
MIELLGLDRWTEVKSVLEDYLVTLEESRRPPPSFIDQMFNLWENQRIKIYAKLDTDNQILGITVLGLESNRISIICMAKAADALDEGEIEVIQADLFATGFNRLKTTGDWILTDGALEGSLREYAMELGFRGFERAFMQVTRDELETIDNPSLNNDMSFVPLEESMKAAIGELIFRGTAGSIDVDVFPMFFSTEEYALKLVQDTIENRFGEFRSRDDSRVLKKDDILVGVCLITIRGSYGYIPDICIDSSMRRMGLGRALLIHTLKRLMEKYSDLDGVCLDVTLENPAKHLYDSLGFKEQRRYEVLNWFKKQHH